MPATFHAGGGHYSTARFSKMPNHPSKTHSVAGRPTISAVNSASEGTLSTLPHIGGVSIAEALVQRT